MIGDRVNTDVKFVRNNGMKTLLVLSDVTTRRNLLDDPDEEKPDYFVEFLGNFFEHLLHNT